MKIYISTTFREFDGSPNDKIQRLFLDRISREEECEIKLIVTTFGEKNVASVLEEYDIDFVVFEEKNSGYRFSLTNVFLNAINDSNIKTEDFVIWTTCDVIFDDHFFSIVKKYCEKHPGPISLISHPHLIYSDVEALENGVYKINGPADGIDFLGFSGAALTKAFKRDIKNNFFSDWGVFEHFLVAVAVKNNLKRFNTYEDAKAKKICNDRHVNNETESYFEMCLNKNWPILKDYLDKNNMSRQYFSLAYCNLMYEIPGLYDSFNYRRRFLRHYLKDALVNYMSTTLPTPLKNVIKRILRK